MWREMPPCFCRSGWGMSKRIVHCCKSLVGLVYDRFHMVITELLMHNWDDHAGMLQRYVHAHIINYLTSTNFITVFSYSSCGSPFCNYRHACTCTDAPTQSHHRAAGTLRDVFMSASLCSRCLQHLTNYQHSINSTRPVTPANPVIHACVQASKGVMHSLNN